MQGSVRNCEPGFRLAQWVRRTRVPTDADYRKRMFGHLAILVLMAATRLPTAPLADSSGGGRRFRGQGRQPLWQRPDEVSVVVLPLVVEGDRERRRLEKLFAAVHSLRRALQRDVRARLRAYWAAPERLQRDAAGWREELGLDREHLERRAYRHLERSGWLLDHLTKALAMHQADEVWVAVS